MTYAINPPQTRRLLQSPRIDLVAKIGHQEDHVLDNALVHIGDVKSPIGPGTTVEWTKTFVGRGNQLFLPEMVGSRQVNAI